MYAPPFEKILSRVFQLKMRSEEVKSRILCMRQDRNIYMDEVCERL